MSRTLHGWMKGKQAMEEWREGGNGERDGHMVS